MAPEYLVRGQLTEKADVFSFGVLVLEIVSGRRISAFIEDSGSLLQTVRLAYVPMFYIHSPHRAKEDEIHSIS